jgi:hypothetical protein
MNADRPIVTFEAIADWLFIALAVLGALGAGVLALLWYGGFFHYLATKFPDVFFAQWLG